ncbi:MAG: hypothetical protein E7564_11445 [Ruminococcaceae bacterium]|nr:hypothetical protein [Oscillospiraceae bacterium]
MSKFNNIKFNDPNWFKEGINFIDCDAGWPFRYLPVGESQIEITTCSEDLQKRYQAAKTRKDKLILQAESYFEKITEDSTVTDMAFCVFMQSSIVDSSYSNWLIRDTAGRVERGEEETGKLAVISKNRGGLPYRKHLYPDFYKDLTENGLDWANIAIEKCAEKGVRPWIYFRMNDLHYVDLDGCPFHDSFFYKAKENGWLIGNDAYGRPDGTSGNIKYLYNFACPEVREWMLNYIEEIILRYDAFGFGLDFMRNIYCFDYLNDTGYQEYMNDFIRKIRGAITKAEEKFGHSIKLYIRIAHTPSDNYVYGFDVETWAKEGLVDVIIASCEEVCNSNVDVDEWRKAIGKNTAFLIGCDDHVIRWLAPGAEKIYHTYEEHVKGLTASYLSRGADGMYFNNYYTITGSTTSENISGIYQPTVPLARHANREKASVGLRTLVISAQDIAPKNCKVNDPLPTTVSGKDGCGAEFSLNIGKIRAEEYIYLTVGYSNTENFNVNVTIDGMVPNNAEEIPVNENVITGHYYEGRALKRADKLVRYRFENYIKDGAMSVHFESENVNSNIVYLEISVNPDKID